MGFQRVSNGHCQPGAAMSEKPIIFCDPMVRSILSGTKTQTRRIIKPKPWNKNGDTVDIGIASGAHYVKGSDGRMYFQFDHPRGGPLTAHVAPYAVGDVLWVREACRADEDMADQKYVEYLADSSRRLLDLAPDDNCSDAFSDWWNLMAYRSNDPGLDGSKPVPSIHMPRWASRITLKVTGVKVERLNDISEDDAVAEGCAGCLGPNPDFPDEWDPAPEEEFQDLWNSIHGPGSWNANPWVCAITFERVQP